MEWHRYNCINLVRFHHKHAHSAHTADAERHTWYKLSEARHLFKLIELMLVYQQNQVFQCERIVLHGIHDTCSSFYFDFLFNGFKLTSFRPCNVQITSTFYVSTSLGSDGCNCRCIFGTYDFNIRYNRIHHHIRISYAWHVSAKEFPFHIIFV